MTSNQRKEAMTFFFFPSTQTGMYLNDIRARVAFYINELSKLTKIRELTKTMWESNQDDMYDFQLRELDCELTDLNYEIAGFLHQIRKHYH